MKRKELARQNFIALFRYSTSEEIERAEGRGKGVFGRLYNEYSGEVERINNAKFLNDSILQHNTEMQKMDLSLEIAI